MLFAVAALCVRWQLPAVAPGQVHVSELGRMEKGDCALLPFDAPGGAFFVTPNNFSVAIDTNRLGYTKGGYNPWYEYNDTTQGLFTLGNNPARVFVCAETTTELRIVGCYLGDNGFPVVKPGSAGSWESGSPGKMVPKQRIGYILVNTNYSMTFMAIGLAKGEMKIRVTEPNGRTTEYVANPDANIPQKRYPYGSGAFVEFEVVEDLEFQGAGFMTLAFAGDPNNNIFPDTMPSDAGGSPKLHSQGEILELRGLESLYFDAALQVPLAPFLAHFIAAGVMFVLFGICWVPCCRIWVSEDEYATVRGEIRNRNTFERRTAKESFWLKFN